MLSLMEQWRLLQIEYEEEKAAFTKLKDRMGIEKLCQRGQAWWPVELRRDFINSLNQSSVDIYRKLSQDEEETPEEERETPFEPGRPVMFFAYKDGDESPRYIFGGTVNFADSERMAIVVADNARIQDLRDADRLGVMLSFDETSYQAMFSALDRVMTAKGRLGELRDLFHSKTLKARSFSFNSITVPYLNESQEKAINKILRAKDVAIVHGPPGTGKTTTLVEAIFETLRREPQVLVCAQSNMAVDWICEKLTERGISVLRIGNPKRITDKMLSFTYERQFEDHPDYPTLWKIRREIREAYRSKSKNRSQAINRLKARATELQMRIHSELFNNARVVASTLVGSDNRLLSGMKFSTLFIDEAAQALEAACWIPIRRAGRVVLAGDHNQLPATVKSYEAMKGGLGTSLMEKLAKNHPEAVTLLRTQYRMHTDIMEFPNRWFYSGMMNAAPEVSHRGILDLDTAMEWVDTSELRKPAEEEQADSEPEKSGDGSGQEASSESGQIAQAEAQAEVQEPTQAEAEEPAPQFAFEEELIGEGGRINRDEALLTLLTLIQYIGKIGKKRVIDERIDFGLISPYQAQVRYLRQLIKRTPYLRQLRRQITINTVDGFQGQERDVVVISMVRSNDDASIGFLNDLRRMNVAITRARMKVIIVGNAETLCRHKFYRKLRAHIRRLGSKSGEELNEEERPTPN